jgi:hypothetical protein
MEVISCLIQRMPSKEIAYALGISHNTVRNHVNNIMKKIDGSCRNDIITFIGDSNYFEIFSESRVNEYSVRAVSIKIKSHLFKNTFLISWLLIFLLCIYTGAVDIRKILKTATVNFSKCQ